MKTFRLILLYLQFCAPGDRPTNQPIHCVFIWHTYILIWFKAFIFLWQKYRKLATASTFIFKQNVLYCERTDDFIIPKKCWVFGLIGKNEFNSCLVVIRSLPQSLWLPFVHSPTLFPNVYLNIWIISFYTIKYTKLIYSQIIRNNFNIYLTWIRYWRVLYVCCYINILWIENWYARKSVAENYRS